MSHQIVSKPSATLGYRSAPYHHAPYYNAASAYPPAPRPDDSCSEDGSIGPQDYVAPSLLAKPYAPTAYDAIAPTHKQQELAPIVAALDAASQLPQRAALKAADAVEMLTHVMTFLKLDDIEAAREAGPVFEAAAARVAPKPLPNKDVVFVRWEPQQLPTALSPAAARAAGAKVPAKRAAAAASAAPAVFPWRCLACGNVSVGPRQCQHCRSPLAHSACRVFLGQLRKELTAELAMAMIHSVAPGVTVLHMESHTNGADGRGKGCAWAYVSSVEDALRVTALHKRVFVDVDGNGAEGFWYVKDAALVPQLGAFAETIGNGRSRPVWFPRQALVAELPAKSMLAEYVKAAGLDAVEQQ